MINHDKQTMLINYLNMWGTLIIGKETHLSIPWQQDFLDDSREVGASIVMGLPQ
jgi:hypothetical protein